MKLCTFLIGNIAFYPNCKNKIDSFVLLKELLTIPFNSNFANFELYQNEFYHFLKYIVLDHFEVVISEKSEKIWETLFELIMKAVLECPIELEEETLQIMQTFLYVCFIFQILIINKIFSLEIDKFP